MIPVIAATLGGHEGAPGTLRVAGDVDVVQERLVKEAATIRVHWMTLCNVTMTSDVDGMQ